jgi:hypothetical protein
VNGQSSRTRRVVHISAGPGGEDLGGRLVAQRLVLAPGVAVASPRANAVTGFGDAGVGLEVNLCVFQVAPQAFDEDLVEEAAFAIQAKQYAPNQNLPAEPVHQPPPDRQCPRHGDV